MKKIDWNNVEAKEEGFPRPTPGGYVMQIQWAEDNVEKEYLKIFMDFAEGKFAGSGKSMEEHTGYIWGYQNVIRSYKITAQGFFKGFLSALEKSNRGFIANRFDGDENKLRGLIVGAVLGEEEYYSQKHGEVRTRLYVKALVFVDKIRNNDFRVPELKKLDRSTIPVEAKSVPGLQLTDEECPF